MIDEINTDLNLDKKNVDLKRNEEKYLILYN